MTDNVDRVLRSIFRYGKLKVLKAPEILIENENTILKKAISLLAAEELYFVVTSWDQFNKNQLVTDELQSKRLEEDLNKFLLGLN